MKELCLLLLVTVVHGVALAGEAGWRYAGHTGVGYDSNPANARTGTDELPSGFLSAGLSAEHAGKWSASSLWLARLSLNAEAYEAQEKLSNAKGTALVRFSLRPGESFYSPSYAAWASLSLLEFASRMRDGQELRGGLFLRQPVTTAVSARVGVQAQRREAESEPFDLGGISGTLDVDWTWPVPVTAYLGYQYYDGDLASTRPQWPNAAQFSDAWAIDDAFTGQQRAYRLDSYAHLGTIGFNYAFAPGFALDAQWQGILAQANVVARYRREFVTLSLLARF